MSVKKNLSLLDYLEALQKEYFLSLVRSQFYYNPKDKQYYKKVYGFKKEKILKIQSENNIPTIFSSQEFFSEVKQRVLMPNGLPLVDQLSTDLENYYSNGSDVKCFTDKESFSLGKIVDYRHKTNIVLVRIINTGNEIEFSCKNCWRLIHY